MYSYNFQTTIETKNNEGGLREMSEQVYKMQQECLHRWRRFRVRNGREHLFEHVPFANSQLLVSNLCYQGCSDWGSPFLLKSARWGKLGKCRSNWEIPNTEAQKIPMVACFYISISKILKMFSLTRASLGKLGLKKFGVSWFSAES